MFKLKKTVQTNIIFIILFLTIFRNNNIYAQKDTIYSTDKNIYKREVIDTVYVADSLQNYRNPTRAALFSALLPGLGQAYNKNYWKIPIIYSAIGATIYSADLNNRFYHRFKTAYIYKTDTLKSTVSEFGDYDDDWLMQRTKRFRRNRDLSIIVACVFYVFNIVDASVDSNLSDYDIGDDISLNIQPVLIPTTGLRNAVGMSLNFRFK